MHRQRLPAFLRRPRRLLLLRGALHRLLPLLRVLKRDKAQFNRRRLDFGASKLTAELRP